MSKIKMEEIVEALGGMTALELNDLSKAIQEKFGISAMPTMSAGPAADAGAAAGGSSDFDVKIVGIGEKKMEVVKFVKGFANLGLKEASDYVNDESRKSIGDLMGKVFKEADAKKLVEDLTATGAKVEMFNK